MPHDSPLTKVHTLGSDEGRMQHNELMDLVTKLSDRVVALETDLRQTKKVYGAAFTKLIKKVKRLEKKDKLSKSRRKLILVLSDEEDEGITLVQMGVSTASTDFTTANVPVTTAGAEISTPSPEVKTTGDYVGDIAAKSLVYIKRSATKTKDKALRLQEQLDEEERQRIFRAHEVASSYNIKEWEDIQARIEVDEELAQRTVLKITAGSTKRATEEELSQQSSKKQKSDELSQEELQQLMIIVPEEGMNIEALQTKYQIIDWEVYTEDSRMYWKIIRVVKLWSLVQERFNSIEPSEDKEIKIWVELKRLFEHDADDELWKSQKHIHDITRRLYDTCGVHHVSTKDGMDIYMLVEREYPCQEVFLHREMDLETAQITTTTKLPTLKQGEYDMWRLRIEQYFQVQDYALWDVIENGNSFKPAAKTTTNGTQDASVLHLMKEKLEENKY
ncbi:hypothetical protein Tco_1105797 [Tanacetum coccineum]